MGIENVKRWHWCVIGVIVGALVAAVRLYAGVDESRFDQYVSPFIFEQQLLARHDPITRRYVAEVRRIVVHPPDGINVPGERAVETEFVTYEALIHTPPPRGQKAASTQPVGKWVPHKLVMQQPSAGKMVFNDVATMPPRVYLDKLLAAIPTLDKQRYPYPTSFTYRYAWIETPRIAFAVFCSAGFIVIGVVWPTVIQLLAANGFGRGDEADEYDLSRFGKGRKAAAARKKAGMSRADIDELERLDAELEAKLRAGATARAAGPADVDVQPEPAIKSLTGGPLETKAPVEVERPRKGYGADQGDYYPTEVHGKKPD
jgi:hypothetical protein